MNKIKVTERATGNTYEAVKIEGGYQLFTLKHDAYKKLKDSTFKRNYKILSEDSDPDDTAESTEASGTAQAESQKDTTEPIEDVSPEKRESLIKKIKKMFALAENNPSQEEATAAALQAQKLMMKYNIHEDDVTLEEIRDDIASVFSQQKHNSHLLKWRTFLANIVAKNFRCKSYLHGKDVVFRGYKQDAEIALEVYTILYETGDTLAGKSYREQKERTGSGKGAYNSFVMGFLKGVEESFGEQSTALMVIVPQEVEEEFEEFSKDFVTRTTHVKGVASARLFEEGRQEGKSAVKARSIETKKGEK